MDVLVVTSQILGYTRYADSGNRFINESWKNSISLEYEEREVPNFPALSQLRDRGWAHRGGGQPSDPLEAERRHLLLIGAFGVHFVFGDGFLRGFDTRSR